MRLGISFRQATQFCLTLCFATAFGGCTYVRVCDDQGNAIADARITYQKFSIGGAFFPFTKVNRRREKFIHTDHVPLLSGHTFRIPNRRVSSHASMT